MLAISLWLSALEPIFSFLHLTQWPILIISVLLIPYLQSYAFHWNFTLRSLCFLASICLLDVQPALFPVNRTWKQRNTVTDGLPGFQFQLCHQLLALLIIFWFAHDLCEVIKIMFVKLHCKGSQLLELVIKVQRFKKVLVLNRKDR